MYDNLRIDNIKIYVINDMKINMLGVDLIKTLETLLSHMKVTKEPQLFLSKKSNTFIWCLVTIPTLLICDPLMCLIPLLNTPYVPAVNGLLTLIAPLLAPLIMVS